MAWLGFETCCVGGLGNHVALVNGLKEWINWTIRGCGTMDFHVLAGGLGNNVAFLN
jgi:hypothetical protein